MAEVRAEWVAGVEISASIIETQLQVIRRVCAFENVIEVDEFGPFD